jgi:hypothetical protein
MLANANVKNTATGLYGTKISPTKLYFNELVEQAKLGNHEAQRILREEHSTKIYTYLELAVINRLIKDEGLTLEEAIERLADGAR